MPERSDTQIRAQVRSILARHRIDLQRTSFTCARGTVRFGGRAARRGEGGADALDAGQLENLESDLRRSPGVVRTHFEFENWRRLESGAWVAVRRPLRVAAVSDRDDGRPQPAAPGGLPELPFRMGPDPVGTALEGRAEPAGASGTPGAVRGRCAGRPSPRG